MDFGFQSKRWNGSVATIVPDPDSHVWGAVWEINIADIPNLDRYNFTTLTLVGKIPSFPLNVFYRQEGVGSKIYEVIFVSPESPDKKTVTCRCYQLCNLPPKITDGVVPEDRKPSLLYLSVILRGATQSQLPQYYIEQLKKIQHNGWDDKSDSSIQRFMLEE